MFTFDSNVRYSETDETGLLSPIAVINYLQDCSTFQSEALGVGIDWLRERHRAWFLNSWRILTDRRPALCEKITVGTFAYGFKGIYGHRHFFIRDEAGAFLVRADSIWFLCDTDTMSPVKPTEEFTAPYLGGAGADLKMGETKRKITIPKNMQPIGSCAVLPHHLDTNHHVNNAQYIAIALSAIGLSAPEEMQAEYRKAAVLGDILHIGSGEDESGARVVCLSDSGGKPYAVLRFRESMEKIQGAAAV